MAKLFVDPSQLDVAQFKKGIQFLEKHDFSGFYDNIVRTEKLRPYLDSSKMLNHNRSWFQTQVMPELREMTAETARTFRTLEASGGTEKDFKDAVALLDAKYASESSEAITEDSYYDLLADSLLTAIGGQDMEDFCKKTTFYPSAIITMMGGI